MADQQKPGWWSTLPGLLTAATGFVAALTGLIAGLTQLGVFQRQEAAPQEVTATATPRSVSPQAEEHTAASPDGRTTAPTQDVGPPAAPRPEATTPAPEPSRQPPRAAAAPSTKAAPDTSPAPAPIGPAPNAESDTIRAGAPAASAETVHVDSVAADSVAAAGSGSVPAADSAVTAPAAPARLVLPGGTALELATTVRACAPESGSERVSARLAEPVELPDATLPPAGTAAVLRLRRRSSPPGLEVRLDSLVRQGSAVAVRRAFATARRGGAAAGCLPTGTRITVTLETAVTLPAR